MALTNTTQNETSTPPQTAYGNDNLCAENPQSVVDTQSPATSHIYSYPSAFESSTEAKKTAHQLRNQPGNARLETFPNVCGNSPFSKKLGSAACADVLGTLCASPTVQGKSRAKGNEPVYRSPMVDPHSVCSAWGVTVRSKTSIGPGDAQGDEGWWVHPDFSKLQDEIHNGGEKQASGTALSYVYDSIMQHTCQEDTRGKHTPECRCLQFVRMAKHWCMTQKSQCDSYGTNSPWPEQVCAMKAFADPHTAVEFQRCAPYFCWYSPCFRPLSESCVSLAVAAQQSKCPGICIQQKTRNAVKINSLPKISPIHTAVIQKIDQDMIKCCGNGRTIPNHLVAHPFTTSIPVNGLTEFDFGAGNLANYTFMIFSVKVRSKKHPQCHLAVRPSRGVMGPKQTINMKMYIDAKYWRSLPVGSTVDMEVTFTYNRGVPKPNNVVSSSAVNDSTQRITSKRTYHATVSDAIGSETKVRTGLTGRAVAWIVIAALLLWFAVTAFWHEQEHRRYDNQWFAYAEAKRKEEMTKAYNSKQGETSNTS